ncbi:MAG: Rid family hydrolase [Treponema sp.]|nr:Rid family hydrolase [Treponema sp.]
MIRKNFSSGAPLEAKAGYSRAVRIGDIIHVGGTTAVQPDGTVYGEGDSYAQMKYILEKQIKIIEQAGGKKEDVYEVRIFQTPEFDKSGMAAYTEIFHDVMPLCTGVTIAKLNRPAQLVEIEMSAAVGSELVV